jgi:DNA-binding protein H-NS
MADFNLEAMSLKELRQLQKDLAKAISTYEDRHKADARAKLEAIAKEMGYSLANLIGVEGKAYRAPAVAKYRHPENAAHTWWAVAGNRSGSRNTSMQAKSRAPWRSDDVG